MDTIQLPSGTVDDIVFTGFWVNHSLGKFHGATLTLDQAYGGLVISFVTLFITTTANSVWKLVRLALHISCASSASSQDGVYHQRQAILRNTTIATDAVVQSLRLGHVWRHRAQRPWKRAMLVLLAASIISIISTTTGILSPILLKGSSRDVLLTGQGCGPLTFGLGDYKSPSAVDPAMAFFTQRAVNDLSSATECYQKRQEDHCGKFVQPALTYTSDKNAGCPFADELCKSSSGNIILDIEDVDSMNDLGLNQGPRFSLSYRTHCAPIVTKGYTGIHRPKYFDRPLRTYKYGTHDKENFVHERIEYNWTYRTGVAYLNLGGTYRVATVSSYDRNITLIPELMQSHDGVSLIFLDASELVYVFKTQDPWFSATTPLLPDGNNSLGMYLADEPTSVVACAVKRLFCNPDVPKSTGCINTLKRQSTFFKRRDESDNEFPQIWPNVQDQLFVLPIMTAMAEQERGLLHGFYKVSGAVSLLSRSTVQGVGQAGNIPPDRWQAELEHVYRASLAAMQSSVVDFARGFWVGNSDCTADFPCRRMCNSQKIRSSKYYSFSTWALVILLGVGSLTMLVAFYLEELMDLLLRRTPLKKRKRLIHALAAWQTESTLQLQRMAHETVGVDSWKRTEEAIPVTRKGELLGIYDTTDPRHVRLIKSHRLVSSVFSSSSDSISAQANPTNMANTNTQHANTFNMSLPALNFSGLSLPYTIAYQRNNNNGFLTDTDVFNTDRSSIDLSDEDIDNLNATHPDLDDFELANLTHSNFDNSTTSFTCLQRTDDHAAAPSTQHADRDVAEDSLPDDDIAQSCVRSQRPNWRTLKHRS